MHGLDEVDGMLVVGLLCAGLNDVDADEEARPTHISQTRVTFCRIDEGVFEQKARFQGVLLDMLALESTSSAANLNPCLRISAICSATRAAIHAPMSFVPRRQVSGVGIMRMSGSMGWSVPIEGDRPVISAVLPWYASDVTMAPVPPVPARATRTARSLASEPEHSNMIRSTSGGSRATRCSA